MSEYIVGKFSLIRHAEGLHNVHNNFNLPDPALTENGMDQAEELGRTFPFPSSVGVVITSPLRRTIQTTLLAFPNILDERYYAESSGKGVRGGADLILEPDLQETSDLPCNTGSSPHELKSWFPDLNFDSLPEKWYVKERLLPPARAAVNKLAERVRECLKDIAVQKDSERRDVIVVTHNDSMIDLTGDHELNLPMASWRSYILEENSEGHMKIVAIQPDLTQASSQASDWMTDGGASGEIISNDASAVLCARCQKVTASLIPISTGGRLGLRLHDNFAQLHLSASQGCELCCNIRQRVIFASSRFGSYEELFVSETPILIHRFADSPQLRIWYHLGGQDRECPLYDKLRDAPPRPGNLFDESHPSKIEGNGM
jgi:broad specificity phosphatase PhoE